MKTKNMWFVFLVLAIFMAAPVSVFGQEDNETPSDDLPDEELPEEDVPEEEEVPEEESAEDAEAEAAAGTTPDSPLWGIDVALDRIRLALASNPNKARIGLLIAEERLAEIQVSGKRGNAEAATRAQDEHGRTLEDVKIRIEAMDGVEVDNETLRGIERGMANHLAALAKVKARIEANPNIPEETKARLLAKFTDLEGRAEELKIKIENRKMRIELKRELRTNETKTKDEVKFDVEGELTDEQQALVDQLVAALDAANVNVDVEIKCEKAGDGDDALSVCETEVDGILSADQQALVDQLADSLELSGTEATVNIEAEFETEVEDEDEADENETEDDEDELEEEDEDEEGEENETEGA
ncbi:MAG TPA: DUF5667 domain-containing protein [Candidatus Nanoarchaeia archaeon]|nr:DUF5667 domain-containing protein [Candidatus Nanoarchaeia archaeon]